MTKRTRRRRGARQEQKAISMLEPMLSKLAPVEVVNEEGVEQIHRASMRLLSEFGTLIVDFPYAVEVFKKHGAKVEGNKVWIDEDLLMHFVRQAPSSWTQLARNPARNLPIGGKHTVLAPIYGPPFVLDLDRGRRASTMEDFHKFSKLVYMSPQMHFAGGTLCEPNDVPLPERHLDMIMALITNSDKAFMGSVTHEDNARDSVAMARILFGADKLEQNPGLISVVNASSPMRWDERMLSVITVYAEARQTVIFTPFIIAGAMSPSTMAATIAQLNAEALFGICYAQMIRPGTPCIYGSFLANIDMKSGAPCFGTAENNLAMFAGGQMARRYNLPYRSGGNFTASRIPDAQAGYESAGTMWPTVQAGTNFVLHAAGWLEGGLIAGYEKFILDLEICDMVARYVKGVGLTDDDFAWDAYEQTPTGDHFLGSDHTMRHYKMAFHQHKVFNMENYEKWEEEGKEDSFVKANKVWKRMLRDYEAPPLAPAIQQELMEYIERRKREIRASGGLN